MMDNNQPIRVRYAPSPTGDPHVGNVRTALSNYLFAKHNSGAFIVRIEDTDKSREVVGSEDKIREGLDWLGLKADESPWDGGDFGPYRQSERLDTYKEYSEKLVSTEHAYYCFCTAERLEQMRSDQAARHEPPRYDRLCRSIPRDVAIKRALDQDHVVRLLVPDGKQIEWHDLVKGEVSFQSDEIDDQVLFKSDGYPTYHLASVVDDHLMEISHVLRGDDWLSSTPKHILLYQSFGWDQPRFGHFPTILDTDKKKLAKRHGHSSLLYFKNELGVHPMGMTHFMIMLGWTPNQARDQYSLSELATDYSLDRVGLSPAIFDEAKLLFLSKKYFGIDSPASVKEQFSRWLENQPDSAEKQFYVHTSTSDSKIAVKMIEVLRDRGSTLSEFLHSMTLYMYVKPTQKTLTQDRSIPVGNASEAIKIIHAKIEEIVDLSSFGHTAAEQAKNLNGYFRQFHPKGMEPRDYLHPPRVAVSGSEVGMNMFEYLATWLVSEAGKKEILSRLDTAIAILS